METTYLNSTTGHCAYRLLKFVLLLVAVAIAGCKTLNQQATSAIAGNDEKEFKRIIVESQCMPEGDYRNGSWQGMIQTACSWNRAKMVSDLLENCAGATPNLRINDDGSFSTLLNNAIRNNRMSCVTVLLSHGANPNMVDGFGMSALDVAKTYNPQALSIMNSDARFRSALSDAQRESARTRREAEEESIAQRRTAEIAEDERRRFSALEALQASQTPATASAASPSSARIQVPGSSAARQRQLVDVSRCVQFVPAKSKGSTFDRDEIQNSCAVAVFVTYCFVADRSKPTNSDCSKGSFSGVGPVQPGGREQIVPQGGRITLFSCQYPEGTLNLGAGPGRRIPVLANASYSCSP